jgi:hypothetical protein
MAPISERHGGFSIVKERGGHHRACYPYSILILNHLLNALSGIAEQSPFRHMTTPGGFQLYATVRFRVGDRGVTEISMSDEEISVGARVPVRGISAVQSELLSAGLLQILPNGNKQKFISDQDHSDRKDSAETEERKKKQ